MIVTGFDNGAALSAASQAVLDPNQRDGIRYVRPELRAVAKGYQKIADCINGSDDIKSKKVTYLPMPDPTNLSEDNVARYEAYRARAVFYNVTQRTALGLLGQIFTREPKVNLPTALKPVETDSDGRGISVVQKAKDATLLNVSFGRLGIFIDYPPVDAPATKADLENGNVRPTISIYKPTDVINWRLKSIGSKLVYTLVVLEEDYTVEDDGFETVTGLQYRELRIDAAGQYFVQIWRPKEVNSKDYEKFGAAYYPKGGDGKPLTEIPFTFVGSKNNESSIDPAPLKDLAEINIGHYCNSADYEEMVHLLGQPMLVITGLDEHWYKEILKEKIPFGSRSGLALPKDATAELIQIDENSAPKEAMEHKERMMVALGAKIVQQREVQRTATESGLENAAEESTLVSVAKNVSAGFKWALEWCAYFLNATEEGIEFDLNSDFELSRMTPEEINATVKTWQDGAISFTEMRDVLRKAGRATQKDEEAKKEIDEDRQKEIDDAANEIGKSTAAVTENSPPPAIAA